MSGNVTNPPTLPECGDSVVGACYLPAPSGKGYVVYEDFQACIDSWMLVPGFSLLPTWMLGAVYLVFLIYLLLGISIVSDLFMDGIVQICSSTRKVSRKDEYGNTVVVDEPVWNWVVANITLMALGTSAPEILLASVETISTLGKPAGELGPSCIVGSSAYNLCGITAMCTISLARGQFKKISEFRVFITTAIWSLWVHLWMLIVYKWWTPDEITLVEGFLTFGQFPLFVFHAYIMDKQPWANKKTPPAMAKVVPYDDMEGGGYTEAPSRTNSTSNLLAPAQKIEAQKKLMESTLYKRAMLRAMAGRSSGKLLRPAVELSMSPRGHLRASGSVQSQRLTFKCANYSYLESAGVADVVVMRSGDVSGPLSVQYSTEDDSAVAGLDYTATQGTLSFGAGELEQVIRVPIIDDDLAEPDVTFYVTLHDPEPAVNIAQPRVPVTIIDDDENGVLSFGSPTAEVAENAGYVAVTVERHHGGDGTVMVDYSTKDGSAQVGVDYEEAQGTLLFEPGQMSQDVHVRLLASDHPDQHRSLRLVLSNAQGGATLGWRTECRVTVLGKNLAKHLAGKPSKAKSAIAAVPVPSDGEEEKFDLWAAYRQQFKDAVMPPLDGDDDEDEEEGDDDGNGEKPKSEGKAKGPTWTAVILHYTCITWKVIFATVPPPEWHNGYPCFLTSLGMIIGVVYVLKETADLFGCTVGLSELMTGISLVAMGTSLPDTFASMISARQDSNADNAIGNITGSNTANVLLGLGVPWVIASCYYKAKGETYVTPAGSLSFSLIIFSCIAAVAFAVILIRRRQGGELGGSRMAVWIVYTILMSLWMMFLVLSGLYDYGHISPI